MFISLCAWINLTFCLLGGKGCGNFGMFESPLFDDCVKCSKYRGLVDYASGSLSSLPYTSSDVQPPAAASCPSGGCVWGYCANNVCNCYAGIYSEMQWRTI